MLGLAAIILGTLYAQERAQTQRQTARAAELEAQLKRQNADLQKQSNAAVALIDEKTKLAARVDSVRKRLTEARTAAATAQANPPPAVPPAIADAAGEAGRPGGNEKKGGGPFAGYPGKMMQDPAIKNMMRSTQEIGIKQMYGDLVKQWALSPDEAKTFYDLLLNQQMSSLDSLGQPEQTAAAARSADDAIKQSLGDQMYDQYKDYQKTVGQRAELSQIKQRLDVDNVPAMTPDQSQGLMNLLSKAQTGLSTTAMTDLASRLGSGQEVTDGDLEQFEKSQTAENDKVAAQAAGMLTPAQLASFKGYQVQMLSMQKMGFQMASKMAAPAKSP